MGAPPLARERRPLRRLDEALSFEPCDPESLGDAHIAELRSLIPGLPHTGDSEVEAYRILVLYAAGPVHPHNAEIVRCLAMSGWIRVYLHREVLRWDRT